MSISAVSGSSSSYGLAELLQSQRSTSTDSDEIAASIVEKDDQDGDGFLSLAETPLDEDRFNEIDTDGDGLISADELSADAQENMSENPPPMEGLEGMAATESLSSSSSSDSTSESDDSDSSDEEYDQYDLNEDGVVTMDELMQALQQGDTSLQSLFENIGGGSQALLQRLASEAYQAQSAA